jgi:hypothetical protein
MGLIIWGVNGYKNSLAAVVYGIKVNDDISHYFQTRKGLQQGYPLSLILFNIVG